MYLVKTSYYKPSSRDRYETKYSTDDRETADRMFHHLAETYDTAVRDSLIDDYVIEVVEVNQIYRMSGGK